MSTGNISQRVKAADASGWQPYHLQVSSVMKSGSLNLLESSGLLQVRTGIASFLPLWIYGVVWRAKFSMLWPYLFIRRFSVMQGFSRTLRRRSVCLGVVSGLIWLETRTGSLMMTVVKVRAPENVKSSSNIWVLIRFSKMSLIYGFLHFWSGSVLGDAVTLWLIS
jgi:hypothetical protein